MRSLPWRQSESEKTHIQQKNPPGSRFMTRHELTISNTSSFEVLDIHMVSPNNLPLLSTLRAFGRLTPHQLHKLLLCQAHTLLLREPEFNRGSVGEIHVKLKDLGELGGCGWGWRASAEWTRVEVDALANVTLSVE